MLFSSIREFIIFWVNLYILQMNFLTQFYIDSSNNALIRMKLYTSVYIKPRYSANKIPLDENHCSNNKKTSISRRTYA